MSDLKAIVLPSGRGVRYLPLSPTQADAVLANAAKLVQLQSTNIIEMNSIEAKLGITQMLKQVSRERLKKKRFDAKLGDDGVTVLEVAKDDYDLRDASIQWDDFSYGGLQDDPTYNKLFTAVDHEVLKVVYRREHNVSAAMVDDIMGKAVAVAT